MHQSLKTTDRYW